MLGRISIPMILVAAAAAAPVRAADLERYRALVVERQALLREKALLEIEAGTAPTGHPYILLDLEIPTLQFRIRGKTLKTYRIASVAADSRGEEPLAAEAIWKRFPGPLEVMEVQGGQPELVPPDPESGRDQGLLYSDPNQLRAETGAVEVDTDAGILGIEVPTEYWILFDEPVVIHVRTERHESIAEQALARLSAMAVDLKNAASRLLGGGKEDANAPLSIWVTLDPETSKELHHSLVPGERIWIVPPTTPR